MITRAKYRRTWFALLREAGVAGEDRHDVQEALTGTRSIREWTRDDWEKAIAEMQRRAGQHNDSSAHVKADRHERPRPGDWSTAHQAETIESLCDKVQWRTGRANGPRLYVTRRLLGGDGQALRRAIVEGSEAKGVDLWLLLTRLEAHHFILALRRMQDVYPTEEPA